MDTKQKQLVGAGVVVLAASVVVGLVLNDPGDDSATTTKNNTVACTIAAGAVPLFVEAITRGQASSAVNGIAGVATVGTCVALFDDLQENPNATAETPLVVESGDGTATPQTSVSLPDLTVPPPSPQQASSSQITVPLAVALRCMTAYDATTEAFLRTACYRGWIQPR